MLVWSPYQLLPQGGNNDKNSKLTVAQSMVALNLYCLVNGLLINVNPSSVEKMNESRHHLENFKEKCEKLEASPSPPPHLQVVLKEGSCNYTTHPTLPPTVLSCGGKWIKIWVFKGTCDVKNEVGPERDVLWLGQRAV